MRRMRPFAIVAISFAACACQNIERSRAVDNPAVAGKTIAQQVCSNCHGVTGVSVSPMFPKLADQPREYLIDQLTDFKSHHRSDPNARRYMWGFTHLTEAQIEELASYFSAQQSTTGRLGDTALVERGATIFEAGLPDKGVAACGSCHGQHGEGVGQFPRLVGQHADYVVKQLFVFQRTDSRPRGAVMKAIIANMSEEEMRAVAAFLEASPSATYDSPNAARPEGQGQSRK
ncbi:c-type cytochrome [Caballeronia telluris]|uniref:Cytochrome c family protein n=1 Tax=Caballeronia telluris TaxID=326475 RepID=A0A158KGR5_9BURK|nr:c-type cytochrome [Caballeronia telluris]SAL79740.1 cytochrome c family protein [Caballeronia telluris]